MEVQTANFALRLMIQDVSNLKYIALDGEFTFFYKYFRVKKVLLQGYVVMLKMFQNHYKITLDDSTGVVPCIVFKSKTKLDVGFYVRIKGKIGMYRGKCIVKSGSHPCILEENESEVEWLQTVNHFRTEFYEGTGGITFPPIKYRKRTFGVYQESIIISIIKTIRNEVVSLISFPDIQRMFSHIEIPYLVEQCIHLLEIGFFTVADRAESVEEALFIVSPAPFYPEEIIVNALDTLGRGMHRSELKSAIDRKLNIWCSCVPMLLHQLQESDVIQEVNSGYYELI